MRRKVETRLEEIQADFLRRTEAAAQSIFEANHQKVFEELRKQNERSQAIEDYHV